MRDRLRRVRLFAELADEALDQLARIAQVRHLRASVPTLEDVFAQAVGED